MSSNTPERETLAAEVKRRARECAHRLAQPANWLALDAAIDALAASPAAGVPQPTRFQINAAMQDAGWQNSAIRQADLDKVERVVRIFLTATPPAAPVQALTNAARDVLAERQRQIGVEGWTPEHDDEHDSGEMAIAAAFYAMAYRSYEDGRVRWPWDDKWCKPKSQRHNLVRAGALILAEIERLDRAALASQEGAAK